MEEKNEISIMIGGKAGDGIRAATTLVGRILAKYGYRVFVYDDYPSLIRGGHNFSIVRASPEKILANKKKVDIMVAFDAKTLEKHSDDIKRGGILIFDSADAKLEDEAEKLSWVEREKVNFKEILTRIGAKDVMKNTVAVGYVSKLLGIEFSIVADVLTKFVREAELNLKVAEEAYRMAPKVPHIFLKKLDKKPLPLLSGNEAIAMGAVIAGLENYYAYPMTPSTSILHFLAAIGKKYGITVVQPENEIAVMLMALGSAYAGKKTMVASSGGGFALMVEGLSLAGQAEIPIVIVVAQRAGPSTGVPTYTMQSDLHFVLNAGHGEFPRFVVAPGDAEEAFNCTALAMKFAWKYQIPAFVLSDKHLSESLFSFDAEMTEEVKVEFERWDGKGDYKRYALNENGISPLAFPGEAVVKSNSYAHDEFGITTEEGERIEMMQEKRLRKRERLEEEINNIKAGNERKMGSVRVYGNSEDVIVTWGSTKGACIEAAETLGLKVVQPVILEPFPQKAMKEELRGVNKIVVVEVNSTGQLARLLRNNGLHIDGVLLKYDARPFFVDELVERLEEVF